MKGVGDLRRLYIGLLIGIIFILLIGCKASKDEMDLADDFERTQKLEVISVENPKLLTTITEDKDIKHFIQALKIEKWDVAEIPAEAVEEKMIKLYQKSVAK